MNQQDQWPMGSKSLNIQKHRILRRYLVSFLFLLPLLLSAQKLTKMGRLPSAIDEASGIEATGPNTLWVHNDDTQSIIYGLDTLGNIKSVVKVGAVNTDWEDISIGSEGSLYIGNFGNNSNSRKDLAIYLISEFTSSSEGFKETETISFRFEDQEKYPPGKKRLNFDVEAMAVRNESIYLFTKNRTDPFTGVTKIYKLPTTPGEYFARLIGSINLGNGPKMENWVTSADFSPDGSRLALLSHDKIWLFKGAIGEELFYVEPVIVDLNDFSQKEGLCFLDNNTIYVVDELSHNLLGGFIYKIMID